MTRTPASLLERLRQPNEESAWSRFVKLYSPLIYRWAKRAGLPSQDAFDLVQEVFVVLVQKMPQFEYDPNRGFRAWLRTITLNKWRDRCRRIAAAPRMVDGASDLAAASVEPPWWDEAEYRQQVVGRALENLRGEFQPRTWQVFWESTAAGRSGREVAAELGLSVNAVYLARSRVLRRLRQELEGLLD